MLLKSLFEIEENLKQKEIFEKELKEAEKDLKIKEENVKTEEKKLNTLKEAKSQFDLKSQKLETKEEQLLNLEEEGRALKKELEDLKQELKEIKTLLSKSKEIEEGFKKLNKLEKENEEYNEKLSLFSKEQQGFGAIKAKEEEINQKIARIQKIAVCPTCLRPLSKSEAEKIIKELQAKLKKEITVPLRKIEQKIKEIGYNKIEHQKIKQEIVRLAHFEEEKNKLNLAKRAEEAQNKLIKKTEESLDKKRNDYFKIFQEKKNLEKEIEKLKPKQEEYLQQERKVEEFREQLLQAQGTYGAFKQRVEDLKKQQELWQTKRKRLEEIKKETGVYKQLSEIFSKKGLQAMIIETVLPEIEQEANKILEKITDGGMKVAFLTSREKKSGQGEIETLEIKIADPFGERDYEMYSGGEGFRIDLAIRVALSKVLSKRAGTKLQFLAIDEGLGSLDQAGKDEVVEAITGLKGDFKKILVVTHIQELKNLFPTRIEVYKDEEGSHLEVVSV
jgi:exonuclease SbcC